MRGACAVCARSMLRGCSNRRFAEALILTESRIAEALILTESRIAEARPRDSARSGQPWYYAVCAERRGAEGGEGGGRGGDITEDDVGGGPDEAATWRGIEGVEGWGSGVKFIWMYYVVVGGGGVGVVVVDVRGRTALGMGQRGYGSERSERVRHKLQSGVCGSAAEVRERVRWRRAPRIPLPVLPDNIAPRSLKKGALRALSKFTVTGRRRAGHGRWRWWGPGGRPTRSVAFIDGY
jgi:hypothetical protein